MISGDPKPKIYRVTIRCDDKFKLLVMGVSWGYYGYYVPSTGDIIFHYGSDLDLTCYIGCEAKSSCIGVIAERMNEEEKRMFLKHDLPALLELEGL